MGAQDIWADALKEAESPETRNAGLWAKCFAEADGDEAKARAAYIKAKVAAVNPPASQPAPQARNDRGWCPACHAPIDLDALYCSACSSNLTANHLRPLKYKPTTPAPNAQQSHSQSNSYSPRGVQIVQTAKSRGTYIILGILFGMLGIHNFSAGRYLRGALQLVSTCVFGWFVIGLIITAIWVLIDLFTVTEDSEGIRLT